MAFEVNSFLGGIGNAFSIAGTVLLIVLLVGLFAGIMFYMLRQMQYKLKVVIHKVLDNGNVVEYRDTARKLGKNGKNDLQLKKLKEVISNPPADFYMKTQRGEQLYFRWDGGHVFVPQKVQYNSPLEFKPATYNILNQMAWRMRNAAERHKNKTFWDLYGNIIVWMMVVVMSAIVLIVLFSKLELVANSINNLATAVKTLDATQVVQ